MALLTQLSETRGHGIVKVGRDLRRFVPAHLWMMDVGTDYWFYAGDSDPVTTASASQPGGLTGWGWAVTSVTTTTTKTGDFISSADDTPPDWHADASSDFLFSPAIFGGYSHALAASMILGYVPTILNVEWYGALLTASANEAGTFMGLSDTGVTARAAIYSDGTNFQLSNGSTTLAGPLIDNAFHLWSLSISNVTNLISLSVDGTAYGTLSVTQDKWPCGFGFTTSTTNRPAIVFAHLWYK